MIISNVFKSRVVNKRKEYSFFGESCFPAPHSRHNQCLKFKGAFPASYKSRNVRQREKVSDYLMLIPELYINKTLIRGITGLRQIYLDMIAWADGNDKITRALLSVVPGVFFGQRVAFNVP